MEIRIKGVLLAGGTGSRLLPLTEVTNKHLLPVGNKPMIEWPLTSMIEAGMEEIMVITGKEHAGSVFQYLGSGAKWDVNLTYRVQDEPKGIAHALSLAADFCDGAEVMLVLGDNIFQERLSGFVDRFKKMPGDDKANILCTRVSDPERFGVVEMKDGKVIGIEEKPAKPKSNLVQTGCYLYDPFVFSHIRDLKPSKRGELEITALNMVYVNRGWMHYEEIQGWWTDAGTPETLRKANQLVGGR